jgi:nicotinate-nucleotide adenylyltransferase
VPDHPQSESRRSGPSASARWAFFGGSFDPVHAGHLSIAHQVRVAVGLDEVVFLPARQSPFKRAEDTSAAHHRLAMLRLALDGEIGLKIDARELDRPGPSFTVETMEEVRAEAPDLQLYFLIGRDHVAALPRWRHAERLAELVSFLVVGREGDPRPSLAALPPTFRTRYVETEAHPASSSEIRRRLREGRDLDDWLKPAVADYARRASLYSASSSDDT